MNRQIVKFLKMERTQVLLILLATVTAALLMVNFVLLPQRGLRAQNRALRERLENHRFARIPIGEISRLADEEGLQLAGLLNEWSRIGARLGTFPEGLPNREDQLNRIDYKVQLYEIRKRLREKSRKLKIQLLPTELGLDDNLTDGEEIRVRMLQLKAVERLADLTLDRQIQSLVEIYPLSPVVHTDTRGGKTFEEFPVRIECDVDFNHLFTFFQSVFEKGQVFTFRNIRIESGPTFASKLRVKAVLSALLFE